MKYKLLCLLYIYIIILCFAGSSYAVSIARFDKEFSGKGSGDGAFGKAIDLAFDSDGNPAISYLEIGDPMGRLKFAQRYDTEWEKAYVTFDEDCTLGTSLEFGDNGNPLIAYHSESSLRLARWNGSMWLSETVDSETGASAGCTMALDQDGNPAISYVVAGKLMLARWCEDLWHIETVYETSEGSLGLHNSLAFDSTGNPGISFCHKAPHYELMMARWHGSGWSIESVDGESEAGRHNSLAFDEFDNPCISYCGASSLKYAWYY